MALANWWVILIGVGLAAIAIAIGIVLGLRKARFDQATGAPLARAERLRALPSFARVVQSRQRALTAIIAAGVVSIVIGGVLAARPMASETIRPENTNRDIMLCLDVSGSMTEVDVEILDVFIELLEGFDGERIGLTIFNSSAVQVFPLTDDYAFVKEAVTSLRDSFDEWDGLPEHYVGTLNGNGASLIGDGLAACSLRFDNVEQERSRSIIFASDNEVNGASIVTVPEAAAYAKSKNIRVFAINPIADDSTAPTKELRTAAESTDGKMYDLRGKTTVSDIITEVQREQAQAMQGDIKVVWHDDPALWMLIFLLGAAGFVVLVWRVKL